MADVAHRAASFFPSVTPSGAPAESRGLISYPTCPEKKIFGQDIQDGTGLIFKKKEVEAI